MQVGEVVMTRGDSSALLKVVEASLILPGWTLDPARKPEEDAPQCRRGIGPQ